MFQFLELGNSKFLLLPLNHIFKELIMLEIVKPSSERITYPVARRDPDYGFIVLFFSESHGVVISTTEENEYNIGDTSLSWLSCKNSDDWEPIDITISG
ncbi:hypothetical protein BHC45_02080 [Snodgrassella alvi]|nr:hypothetical protein BGH96_00255 [Snodgrassella alvi]PIT46629.1 hypothetical protein BHC45_02080 [Snodgrassella alvi]PIT63753.1 hypothetical protein BHC52_10760 [Snodgrassella alvi]